ncbi:DUF4169 family protein [Alisedimentitalea sp. MJ-SS2]|uniref:DUF4169 family protein n=1 Tax=Aliisedimentitalea sp. MJ-SS2 TaxID=3049795 RepID=UPI002907BDA4|nr:DUF4169 family protein [Alisedimentitalea sp. MJ-SS2]MDU8929187.1 DUF4169 family protein [Alisedimentitalea sp. MJ-SS2]
MAEIVNFNKARKARAKVKKRAQADENAVKFGRSKARKSLDQARADKATRELDGKKRDPET